MSRGALAALCGLALVAFAAQVLVVARTYTPTPDEFIYVPTGYYHLRTGDLTFDTTNPPLLKMAMGAALLPFRPQLDLDPRWRDNRTGWGAWIFATRFMSQNRARYLDMFFAARAVVVALGVALGVLLFVRARQLLSPAAALVVLVLYASMPPLLAHGGLATLDMGLTAFIFAAFCALARLTETRSLAWAAAAGVLLGLAFAIKGTAALFFPLVPVLVTLGWPGWGRQDLGRFVAAGVAIALGLWVALLAAYGFRGFPLPAPLIEGVRFQIAASSAGEFPAFLAGEWSQTGWWHYYLVALVLKTPLATLVLLLGGLGVMAARRFRGRGDLWVLLPPLVLLYILSFHYGKNYGIRYLLPAFPFLLLIAGTAVDALLRRGLLGRAVVGALVAWQVAASLLAAPHHLAYFNELVGGPEAGRRYLLDSNVDWGQDLGALAAYLRARGERRICLGYFGHVDPHVYGIEYSFPPTQPAPGRCALSANFLAGYPYGITYAGERVLGVRPGLWSWYDRLQPVERIGSSIYVFDVTPADVARLGGAPPPG
ncbi:MAG TPA: glycosyltransferase family 39 protein [Candidatus Limnocylindria bacterium]|nr:glycosyltransferase family 39 protein [Candidatus Limnocylindria bacterium]